MYSRVQPAACLVDKTDLCIILAGCWLARSHAFLFLILALFSFNVCQLTLPKETYCAKEEKGKQRVHKYFIKNICRPTVLYTVFNSTTSSARFSTAPDPKT